MMVISKTPLRISLVGGGSDLPEFCSEDDGAVVAFPINKYIYVTIKPHFNEGRTRLATSVIEDVANDDIAYLRNDIARWTLERMSVRGVDINSIADIPAGIGLGSSSAFAVGLRQALEMYSTKTVALPWEAGYQAFNIERYDCKRIVGSQDHIVTSVGNFGLYAFRYGGPSIKNSLRLALSVHQREKLEANLLLLWTGKTHDASETLRQQVAELRGDSRRRANFRAMANIAVNLYHHLQQDGDPDFVADALRTAWVLKRKWPGVTDPDIDRWYDIALDVAKNKPFGGKLLGAGGGGCLLFYAPAELHQDIIRETGLRHIPFKIADSGCQVTTL